MSDQSRHTSEIVDGGSSLYHVIRRNGVEIGRAYAGSWDDDFGDSSWDEYEISKKEAIARVGDVLYDLAVTNSKSVRYDDPEPDPAV